MSNLQQLSHEAITAARQAAFEDARHDYLEEQAQEARDAIHERHGGNEYPDRDDCTVCIDAWESWMLWGISIDTRVGL